MLNVVCEAPKPTIAPTLIITYITSEVSRMELCVCVFFFFKLLFISFYDFDMIQI